jgi:hypothetical protein
MNDLNSSKLACLASVQQTFPNDDLKLFDLTITPTKMYANSGSGNNTSSISNSSSGSVPSSSSSSLSQTFRYGLEKMAKFNLINTTPVTSNTKVSIFNSVKVCFLFLVIKFMDKFL